MCDHCSCRSFAPIAELTAEHEQILELAWHVAEAVRAGDGIPSRALAELLALLDVHVAKEETGLYPALRAGGRLSEAVSDDLEDEHRALRATLAGGRFDRRGFYELAAHIEVEELELFPAAMLGFDEEEWADLERAHRAAGVTAA
jgi:hemerythrin-like domain-containing protein